MPFLISAWILSHWMRETTGPMLVPSARGSPALVFSATPLAMAATSFIFDSGTIIRVGALHDCPELLKTCATPPATAFCRSASSRMTLGDLPPSSWLTRLTVGAARLATSMPARVEPVKEIMSMSGCSLIAAPTSGPRPLTRLNTPLGTPASARISAKIRAEAGVPKGVFNLVNGLGPEVGAAMSEHPDIDMISFTGSTRAGIDVARRAAPTVKRVSQELGGKSPNVILEDADLQKAVAGGVAHVFNNSGQSCNAPTRMIVPLSKMKEVAAIARGVAEKTKAGDPRAEGTNIGPVVSRIQWDKIQKLIQKGIEEGATLVAGGPGLPEGVNKGFYVRPTIFADVTNDMTIAREEIFGPVLTILGAKDEADAVKIANDTPYGLAGYVSGDTVESARRVARQIRAGNINLQGVPNDRTAPFGGYKQSGNGREWGKYGLEEYLEVKAVAGYNAA